MESFISWDILSDYVTFVSIVFMLVEFTKSLPLITKIATKYWSFIISLILLIIINLQGGSFRTIDIVLYVLSAVSISLGSNGLSNFNKSISNN